MSRAPSRRRDGRPALEAREGVQLLLGGAERRQRLRRVRREDAAGLREPAPAPVALDEAVTRRRLEQPEVLARARLPDADRAGRGGQAPLSLDLDEQSHPGRIPERTERGRADIRCVDGRHRRFRLSRLHASAYARREQ